MDTPPLTESTSENGKDTRFVSALFKYPSLPKPFIIALSGPSGSGKSFIREFLLESLGQHSDVSTFTQDNYYRDFEADFPHLPLTQFYDQIDLDDPTHIQFSQLRDDLLRFRQSPLSSVVTIPKLRFGTPHQKPSLDPKGLSIPVTPILITEGIHAFYDPALLPHYDLKIFVDIQENIRRKRWLARNQRENRGTTDNMWQTTVSCLERFILPTRSKADLIIDNSSHQDDLGHTLTPLVSQIIQQLGNGIPKIAELDKAS